MAAIDRTQALLLSQDALASGLNEEEPKIIQLAEVLPFYPVSGNPFRYATADELPDAEAKGIGEITDQTTNANDPNREARFAQLVTKFQVSYGAQEGLSNVNDQVEVQKEMAKRRLQYKFWDLFESGDTTAAPPVGPAVFDGLKRLIDEGNEHDAGNNPLTATMIHKAISLLTANNGYPTAIYTSLEGWGAIFELFNTDLMVQYVQRDVPSPCGGTTQQPKLAIDGIPVYKSSYVVTDGDPPVTSIYFMVLGPDNLHGIYPADLEGDSMFVFRKVNLTGAAGSTMEYHCTFPAGIALGSKGALSSIINIQV